MRYFTYIKAIAVFTAVALCSCQKPEEELTPDDSSKSAIIRVVSDMPSLNEAPGLKSKTLWDGQTILWSAGDMISVGIVENFAWHKQLYASVPLDRDMEYARFSIEVPSSLTGNLQLYSVYPSSAVKGDLSSAPDMSVSISSLQTPAEDSFDPCADLMVGKTKEIFDGIPQDNIPLYWNRLVAHADVTLTSLMLKEGETVESVTLKAQNDAALTGDFTLNVLQQVLTPTDEGTSSEVIISGDNLRSGSGDTYHIWASVAPCVVTSLEVTVTTDHAVYVRCIPSCSLDFKRNTRNILSIDMSSAEEDLLPAEKEALNARINSRIFELLNLDAQGMETVKSLYAEGELYEAATALKEYWQTGRTIVNPDVDLSNTAYSAVEKNKADQALKENGYRFYVKNYAEVGDDTDANAQYYSFSDGNGGINWSFALEGETQFNIQKHRHQWVLPQAKVYWGTKNEIYVKSYVEVYTSWLNAHPCPGSATGNYIIPSNHALRDMWTDLQATSRVVDQISVLDYYVNSENFSPEFMSHFLVSFADAVECIRANPYHEQLSNHRLYEIQAVFMAALMMPEFKASQDWLNESSADMEAQLRTQFADDGVLVEMDPGYHIPMVAIFYDSHKIAIANGRDDVFPQDYKTHLKKAVRFIRDLAYPDYSLENFNDVRSSSWNKSTLTKNFKKYYAMFPEDPTLQYWATGFESGTPPEEHLSMYTTTGWYMLRNGWDRNSSMLILKNNYNAKDDGGVWWHCQPDNGTVSLYHRGRHFLPDAGAYTYTNGSAREEFRATAMHNTLTRNLETIADTRMRGEYVNSSETDDCLMVHIKNQSYGNLRHERVVFQVEGRYYVIVDAALGSAKNTSVELNWHLCPGEVIFDAYGSNAYGCHTGFADGNNMMFKTFCFSGERGLVPDTAFEASTGTSYTSSEINEKTARRYYRTAVDIGASNTPVRFITVIYPIDDYASAPDVSAAFGSAPTAVVVTIDGESRTLTY